MKKIFYIFCFLWIAFALFLVIGSKIPSVGRYFIVKNGVGNYSFGDLYEMAQVGTFKGHMEIKNGTEKDTIENAKVIVMGDSFFQTQYDSEFFGNELEKKIKRPVFAVRETVENPLEYLSRINYQKGAEKTLILESIERFSLSRGLTYAIANNNRGNLKNVIFQNMEYFFYGNLFVKSVQRFIKQIDFTYLNQIDERTPLYSISPPMLFFKEELDFDNSEKPDNLIHRMADNVKNLSRQLKEKYNLNLIYVVIPNKYTIYNDLVKNGFVYDDFIPRLNKELERNGVTSIDLYKKYKEYRETDDGELLYYTSDTHYTALGKEILANEAVKTIFKN